MTRRAAYGIVMLMAVVAGARPSAESRVSLTVRLYNASGVSADQMQVARRVAEPILGDTGLDVIFRECGRPDSVEGPGDPCDDPLKASEVVVRIIRAPLFNTTLHPQAYGVTYVVEETNHGWLATVFSDRIAGAAARAGVQSGTLLGRVMAHEVGHLLLGSGYHGDAGVMRAEWPDALLHDREVEDWRFSRREAVTMLRAVATGLH
jgi:hypothetical protein